VDKMLGLICARGGSKGIPGKNLKTLAGRPLLAWTATEAAKCQRLTRLVLSTDCAAIAECGRSLGLEVPFMRPARLASDTSPVVDAVLHAAVQLQHDGPILLLQPTNPLRMLEDIVRGIALWDHPPARGLHAVMSIAEAREHPWQMYVTEGPYVRPLSPLAAWVPRQKLSPLWVRDGSIYITTAATCKRFGAVAGGKTAHLVIPPERSLRIDQPPDWQEAERLLAARHAAATVKKDQPRRPRSGRRAKRTTTRPKSG